MVYMVIVVYLLLAVITTSFLAVVLSFNIRRRKSSGGIFLARPITEDMSAAFERITPSPFPIVGGALFSSLFARFASVALQLVWIESAPTSNLLIYVLLVSFVILFSLRPYLGLILCVMPVFARFAPGSKAVRPASAYSKKFRRRRIFYFAFCASAVPVSRWATKVKSFSLGSALLACAV